MPSGSASLTFSIASFPVANEYKIRMACHPQDPGVPPEGYQGVNRVLGTVDGLKKFITIQESPYHGLNFCQGTISEDLENPGVEIFDVIRYFGTRKKIFNVHFRNIRGHRNDFVEVYPDEGDVDFVKAIRVYKEIGYPYMLMPDHVPLAAKCRSRLPAVVRFLLRLHSRPHPVGQRRSLSRPKLRMLPWNRTLTVLRANLTSMPESIDNRAFGISSSPFSLW